MTSGPDAARVARRSLVLSAVVCRSLSDHDPGNSDAQDLWNRLSEWVRTQDIDGEMDAHERELVCAPLGSLDEKDRITATWRVEGLALLAWALSRFPFPAYDQQVDPYEVTDSLEFLSDDAFDLLSSSDLKPVPEIAACRELYYGIHCRLRQYLREREPKSISHWIENEWLETLGIQSIVGPTGDLKIDNMDLSDVDDDVLITYESLVYERHRAAIWLRGDEGPGYSDFPVDT